MIDSKTILDGIVSLIEEIEGLKAPSIEKIIEENDNISQAVISTLNDFKKNNYTLRIYNKDEDFQKLAKGEASYFGCAGDLLAGSKNEDESMSPFPYEVIPCEDPNALDLKYAKESIDRMCFMSGDKVRNNRLDANAFHAIAYLNKIKAKVIVLGNCDPSTVYNSVTKCDNYKLLMNLLNTLKGAKLVNTNNGKLLTILSKFTQLIDDCKPLQNKDTQKNQSDINTGLHEGQRIVQSEKLNPYFIATFKGMGGATNYFDIMIKELQTNRSVKEFAQIAWMIYDGGKMNQRKPKTFAKWYRVFCECVGVEYSEYKPNKLKKTGENLKKLFNYLS